MLIFEVCTPIMVPNIPWKYLVDWARHLGGDSFPTDEQTTGFPTPYHTPSHNTCNSFLSIFSTQLSAFGLELDKQAWGKKILLKNQPFWYGCEGSPNKWKYEIQIFLPIFREWDQTVLNCMQPSWKKFCTKRENLNTLPLAKMEREGKMKRVLANRFDAAVAAYISPPQHPGRRTNMCTPQLRGNGNRLILVVMKQYYTRTLRLCDYWGLQSTLSHYLYCNQSYWTI